MKRNELICLAYASLMALALVGTYVLGDDSWMAYLLFVPAFLILKAMDAPRDAPADQVRQQSAPGRARRRFGYRPSE